MMNRYESALHAMQSGVAMEMNDPDRASATEPKHLRVGINAAMADHAGLVTLLIEKGVFTMEEYLAAICGSMEQEKKRYEKSLSAKLGKIVSLGLLLLFIAAMPAFAQDTSSAFDAKKITLGQVREIQMALASIETRDGKPVPTCLGDIKAPCIPLAISSAIADDLAALSPHWVFYQNQAHKLIGDASGGTGYLAPGSKEETVANYRLFELNGQPVTVRIRPVDVNGLEASGVQVPPTIKAVLAPVSR
jgi:hypothetical protein